MRELQLACVLHSRNYRESSLLLEVFTQEHGRIAVIAKGAKTGKQKKVTLLQQFQPIYITWYGNGDLVTLGNVEPATRHYFLTGKKMLCGLYINELLVKLLHKHDPHPELFSHYLELLTRLASNDNDPQVALRLFENKLLQELGYGIAWDITSMPHHDAKFSYSANNGLQECDNNDYYLVSAQSLQALFTADVPTMLQNPIILKELKQLMRVVFNSILGVQQISTRKLG